MEFKKHYNKIKDNIYTLDMNSLKSIANKIGSTYNIYIETNNGVRKTSEIIFKNHIIDHILTKIKTGKTDRIVYSKKIINYSDTKNITKNSKVYYGQYNTTDKNVYKLLLKLTDGKFSFGSNSQTIVKEAWKRNILLTYKQLADMWLQLSEQNIDHKEWAYINCLKETGDKDEWKKKKEKAIKYFKQIELL